MLGGGTAEEKKVGISGGFTLKVILLLPIRMWVVGPNQTHLGT